MAPQKTLQAFLATARAALTAPPSKRSTPLHFVVGNESADLDSLCSALFLAYFRSHEPPHTLHIPLCHLAREDLALRPEFGAVLRRAAVSPDDVLTLTELPGPDRLRAEDTRWLLVDHNAPTGTPGRLCGGGRGRGRVVGCIDHHEDEGRVPRDADPRVIERSGSCMSLVVERCAETWDALAEGNEEEEEGEDPEEEESRRVINSQLAYLALAPILVDTNNLGSKDKTCGSDERAAAVARARLRAAAAGSSDEEVVSADIERFSKEVFALKEDISGMSIRDILRKDYKEWNTAEEEKEREEGEEGEEGEGEGPGLRLGTSSVPQPFAFLVDKAGGEKAFAEELERWSASKKLDVTVVLTTCKADGKFSRELLVWARTGPEVVAAVKKFAEGDGKEKLGLETWGDGRLDAEDGEGSWRRCWTQSETRNSRKQIAPMFRDALKGVSVGKT
ncbi:ATPase synthesis protein 25 mitochondrial [Hypoxylon texense]